VTDANLVLGRLSEGSPLAGGVRLDLGAAESVIASLARSLDLSTTECAEGILRVAVAEMVGALRVVTVRRGVDPRGFSLLAFGGAGPLHAAQIASELGIRRALCPRASGVLAALGLIVSQRRRDIQRSVFLTGSDLSAETIATTVAELSDAARRALGQPDAEVQVTYELRYRGQSFELAVAGRPAATPDELRRDFEAEHERRYGYSDPDQTLELVTIRTTAVTPGADLGLSEAAAGASPGRTTRAAILHGRPTEVEVIAGSPTPGERFPGPAVVEMPESTVLVPPEWTATVDGTGTICLEADR
jgi:N-methylhydantoinase A/oxoprolinase/acetone carboxylase beta subunit